MHWSKNPEIICRRWSLSEAVLWINFLYNWMGAVWSASAYLWCVPHMLTFKRSSLKHLKKLRKQVSLFHERKKKFNLVLVWHEGYLGVLCSVNVISKIHSFAFTKK